MSLNVFLAFLVQEFIGSTVIWTLGFSGTCWGSYRLQPAEYPTTHPSLWGDDR